jgi:hypothetical protein
MPWSNNQGILHKTINMNDKDVLQSVNQVLTEEPVSFDVTYTDLLKKSRKRTFKVKPLVLGSLARISSLYISIDMEKVKQNAAQSSFEIMKDHCRSVAEIVAIAVTNEKQYPSQKLIDFFYYNLNVHELADLLVIILKQADVVNFILTIASMKNLNVLNVIEKKEVSQQSQGS